MFFRQPHQIGLEQLHKVYEEGLDKHEAWRPTFTTNVIQILVRDLVRKMKDPNRWVTQETKEAQEQPHMAQLKIKFIEDFRNVWFVDVSLEDDTYQRFINNFEKEIPSRLEEVIPKLGTWIIKCDGMRTKLFNAKLWPAEATNKILDMMKKLEHVQE